jgi:hypothetical protein
VLGVAMEDGYFVAGLDQLGNQGTANE